MVQIRARFNELRRVSQLWMPAPLNDFVDYDEYWTRRGQIQVVHSRWSIAASLIPDGCSVLDVGCGSGRFLSYLRQRRPHCSASGIDPSEQAVLLARAEGNEASVVDLLTETMQAKFDVATCLEVLEHVPHAELLLEKLMSVVNHQLIVSIPNVGFIGCRLRLGLFGRFPTTLCVCHMREHVRFWTVRDFHEWIDHCGFRVVGQYPQHGVWLLWRRAPSLFASGMVYVIERHVSDQGRAPVASAGAASVTRPGLVVE